MRFLSLILLFPILTSCQNGGGGDSSKAADPVLGSWYYVSPGATNLKAKGIIAKIDADKIFFAEMYAYSDGNSNVYYYRKSEGTYKREGNRFFITYNYETCNPVGSETVDLTATGSQLTIYLPSKGIGLNMLKSVDSSTSTSALAIEDKKCNILAKIEKTQKRSVAKEKQKSFFQHVLNN